MDSLEPAQHQWAENPSLYIGKDLNCLPKPAAILDLAKTRRHCDNMLKAIKLLGLDFRAHVKTHKTIQLAEMQVGRKSPEARFAVSTVAELEHMLPMLRRLQRENRKVNVLYGVPLPPSKAARLAKLGRLLGPGSITLMLDHPGQLRSLRTFYEACGHPPGVFLKIDTGYHRAGLPPHLLDKEGLVERLLDLQKNGVAQLVGLYSHSSLSYNNMTRAQSIESLMGEISGCLDALYSNQELFRDQKRLVLSVGASPQVTAVQGLAGPTTPERVALTQMITKVSKETLGDCKLRLELHAGVYSVMDLQQLATGSVDGLGKFDDEIALSVLAEVVSVYNDGERATPEALIAAGTLALGREPCQSYNGWGRVSQKSLGTAAEDSRQLIVSRISQEHSILSWEDNGSPQQGILPSIPLSVGQGVRIYPNHACVTGAMYRQYFVVDSSVPENADRIIDVWERACGW